MEINSPLSIAGGQTIQFTYDSLDQLRSRTVGANTTTYFTDPLGRYETAANGESVDTVKFDSADRPMVEVTCRVLVSGNPAQCFRDSSVYEVRDLRDTLTVSAPGLWSTRTATYHYDVHMLLDALTNFGGEQQTFTYTGELLDSTRNFVALNNLKLTYNHTQWLHTMSGLQFSDTTLSRSVGSTAGYDSIGRVTGHYHGRGATPDTVRTAAFDHGGRLLQYGDTAFTWADSACTVNQSYTKLGELCDYSKLLSAGSVTGASYAYDAVGNRDDGTNGIDPGSRLRRWQNFRMTYDADGNLTVKQVLKADTTKVSVTDSLFWSATGQLDSLHVADSTGLQTTRTTYGYDAWGRRVRFKFGTSGGNVQRYLWDGNDLVFRTDTLGALTGYWTFYPTGELQSHGKCCNGDTTLYYVTDALHNIAATIKSAGGGSYVLYNQLRYDPFGHRTLTGHPTGGDRAVVQGGLLRWRGGPLFDGGALLRPRRRPLHLGGPDRARGWDQPVHVRGKRSRERVRSERDLFVLPMHHERGEGDPGSLFRRHPRFSRREL